MNIIELMQSIVMSFPKLNDVLHIDYTTPDADSYGLSPTGDTLIKSDVLAIRSDSTHSSCTLFISRLTTMTDLPTADLLTSYSCGLKNRQRGKR